jgi:hypothetical protein
MFFSPAITAAKAIATFLIALPTSQALGVVLFAAFGLACLAGSLLAIALLIQTGRDNRRRYSMA